jgi:HEPN domain-containing protein
MKPLIRDWIEKAEGDFATASREMRARKSPNYDAACFHSQQCVEKYFKALLQETAIPFGKTHHLISLPELIISVEPSMEMLRPQLQSLNTYSVEMH